MVAEVLYALQLQMGDVVVDGTLGLGGHSAHMLESIGPAGKLIGLDWDASMLQLAKDRLWEKYGNQVSFVHADYRSLADVVTQLGVRPNAILLDLGLNSAQIDDADRGIAFSKSGPLDMRMDRSSGEPASALLNRLGPDEIEDILFKLGDERWARAIAREIVKRRKDQPLRTTQDLVDAVLAAVPPGARDKRINPATRTFQAVRIAVNRELDSLDEAIMAAARTLAPGGTLAVLSYHSGEDRAVKSACRMLAAEGEFDDVYRKPLTASPEEIALNPRARSAKLRALRYLGQRSEPEPESRGAKRRPPKNL